MKIAFWVPDSLSTYKIRLGVYPPVGLLILASIARERGFETVFLDSENEGLSFEQTLSILKEHAPDVLAFSMTTPYVRILKRQLPAIRKLLPNAIFLTGGPHPSARREHVFGDVPCLDMAIYGEGENSFSHLLNEILGSKDWSQVPSLIYRDHQGQPICNVQASVLTDLDAIPFPAYDLVQHLVERYPATFPSRAKPSLHIMAGRGCPFSCTYCSNAVFGSSLRMRSVEHVLQEAEYLVERLGARELFFQDDTLNCSTEYFLQLCEGVISRNLHRKAMFKVVFRANKNLVSPDLLAKAKEAGIWMIFYGVESGDPQMLQRINKQIDMEELKRAFLLTRQAGIKSHASFMIGNLGEDWSSIEKSYDLCSELLPDTFCFSIANPYPGTRFYSKALEQGLIYAHEDFVDEKYPNLGISRTEALTRDEIAKEKENVQEKCLRYINSKVGLMRIHEQYADAGREDLWEKNRWFHENPVLWTDYDILNLNALLEYPFLAEKLQEHLVLGQSDYGLGEGWHTAENWPPSVRHFRKRAHVFLKKPAASHATLNIRAYSGYLRIAEDPIRLSIAIWGKVLIEQSFQRHEWSDISVSFSPEDFHQPFLCVELAANKTWTPDDFLKNGDLRQLGLAVSAISIEFE